MRKRDSKRKFRSESPRICRHVVDLRRCHVLAGRAAHHDDVERLALLVCPYPATGMSGTPDIHGRALGPHLGLRVEEVDGGLDVEVMVAANEHDRRRVDGHEAVEEGGEGQ